MSDKEKLVSGEPRKCRKGKRCMVCDLPNATRAFGKWCYCDNHTPEDLKKQARSSQ